MKLVLNKSKERLLFLSGAIPAMPSGSLHCSREDRERGGGGGGGGELGDKTCDQGSFYFRPSTRISGCLLQICRQGEKRAKV